MFVFRVSYAHRSYSGRRVWSALEGEQVVMFINLHCFPRADQMWSANRVKGVSASERDSPLSKKSKLDSVDQEATCATSTTTHAAHSESSVQPFSYQVLLGESSIFERKFETSY